MAKIPAELTPHLDRAGQISRITLGTPSVETAVSVIHCPAGHVTHSFLACDVFSACWRQDVHQDCAAPMTQHPPMFQCAYGFGHVPMTLVCDFRRDCPDNSDESFCVLPPCDPLLEFECGNHQCAPFDQVCDDIRQCLTGLDEAKCRAGSLLELDPPDNVVDFRVNGTFKSSSYTEGNASFPCPETHFQCPRVSLCLPVYVRCNGALDCPGREDEMECDRYTCPGFYRCRDSKVCLHPDHMCDGVWQCPQRDDEWLCDFHCPRNCRCYGLALYCNQVIQANDYSQVRFLDARGSGMTLLDVENNTMLIHLALASCGIVNISKIQLPNLRVLDLSDNNLTSISGEGISGFTNLQVLYLSGNPVSDFFSRKTIGYSVPAVRSLHLSNIDIHELRVSPISQVFDNLETLNLSGCGVTNVFGEGFQTLTQLRVLDLRGCPVTYFPRGLFQGLTKLQDVYSDNHKLCCKVTLPEGFNLARCRAPVDEVSSCAALLRSDMLRVVLTVLAVLALLGNSVSFLYRLFVSASAKTTSFGVFVMHLCASDFLMGLYLAVIGVADRIYMGTYVWEDLHWKQNVFCTMGGFLSFLSSEVSAFIVCLITVDRFLVIRFPFSTLRFTRVSAHVACGIAWMIGLVLVSVPLMTSHWEFYSQTSICIPLPITKTTFAGQAYSFGVMIVLNFVLFLIIALGQVLIYASIRNNSMSTMLGRNTNASDQTVVRRLLGIVVSDFFCWFPIGLMGLLASTGVPISGEINVAMAIFVLPFNSAVNPFLYTINILLERRQKRQEQRLRQMLLAELRKAERKSPGSVEVFLRD